MEMPRPHRQSGAVGYLLTENKAEAV